MNAGRAFPISLYSPSKHHRPPDSPPSSSISKQFKLRLRFLCTESDNNGPCFSVLFNTTSHRRKSGKVWADVKSDAYEMARFGPHSLKFGDGLELDDVKSTEEDGDGSDLVPWWEEFLKRWVIVLLCFSAFLLSNMAVWGGHQVPVHFNSSASTC